MANHFYQGGKLDRQYLRNCAVYRLMKRGLVGKARAIELIKQRGLKAHTATALVELWIGGPFKRMAVSP